MAWSRVFQTCIIYHFLDNFFFQTFLLYNWILQKKNSIFANSQFFLQILKVEHKSFPIIICHIWTSNMGFREGGGSNWPPPSPSRFSSTPAGIGLTFLISDKYRMSHETWQLMNSLECRLPNTGIDLKTFCSLVCRKKIS